MDIAYALDLWLFHLGNQTLANPVFDVLLPFLTNLNTTYKAYFFPLFGIIFAGLIWKGGKRGRLCVLLLILTLTASDVFSSRVLKEAVGRVRPCHVLPDVRSLVDCGEGKSFPSSHAVNNFAAAIIFGFFYPAIFRYWLIFASLIAYSRVYCGVHYPSDILGGAIVGSLMAILLLFAWERLFQNNKFLSLPFSVRHFF